MAVALANAGCAGLWGFDDLVAGDAGKQSDVGTSDAVAEASIDAPVEAEAGPTCITDLSGVGTADFQIAFTLTTTSTQGMALLNQIGTDCTSAVRTYWDVWMSSSGGIIAVTQAGDSTTGVVVEAGNAVNDGKPHRVVVARESGLLWYSRDGVLGSSKVPDAFAFGAFPALTVGTDTACGRPPLAGTLADLCITEACALVTHSNGIGQMWQDCAPLGTYDQVEATAACVANGGLSCVVNTCSGAGQAVCDVNPHLAGYCSCWGFSGQTVIGRVVDTGSCTDPSLAGCVGLDPWQ